MKAAKKTRYQLELGGMEKQIAEFDEIQKTQKQVTEKWRESEEKYKQIVDNSLVGLYIAQNFILKFCNQRLAEIFGYDNCKELLGMHVKKLVDPGSWKLVEEQIKLREAGEKDISHYEFRGVKKDGTIIEIETLGTRIIYQGKPAIQGSIRDITERKSSEEALRASEKRFRMIFEGSPDGIYVVTSDGEIVDINLAGCLLHSMGRGELVGKNLFDLVPPQYREEIKKSFPKLFAGEINYLESCVQAADGVKVPVEIRSRKIQYSGKSALMLYIRDVSERVRVGQSFEESQRILSTLMSNLPGMAYRCLNNKERTMKFVSQGSFVLTGYQPEDLMGHSKTSFANLILPEYQNYIWDEIQKALDKKQPYKLEYKIKTAAGEEKWVWEQGRGVFSNGGSLIALEGIVTDINDLKHAESALRESENRFRSLIENVPSIAVQGYDKQRNIIFWNKASEKLYGYTKEEALGQKLEKLIVPEYLQEKMVHDIEEWVKHGKEIPPTELGLKRKDGSIFEVHSSYVMLKNIHDEPELYCVDLDLTELNRAKKELQKSLYKLKRALDGTVRALMSAVEMRDPYTAGHQTGVARLACAIAEELGLSKDQIEGLRVASLLHDIGKLNIPSEILNKPGPLSDIEYSLLKSHPQFGFEILRTINFPWPVAQMVLQHHERIDGSGYPQGLKDDKMMLEAKIICVADVVEPISSHRPYRPALGIERALEEIENGRGITFDPEVVDVCVKLFREKGFSFNNHLLDR